ncbi:GRTP1 [Symbiodinium sp. CCMP2592]|nr:GRTP1 [Symbiodinium sp. CCMP2592]
MLGSALQHDRERCLARALLASECRSAESSSPSSSKTGLPMLLKIRRSWCGTTAADSSSTPLMRRQSLSLGADGWAVDSMPTLSDPVPTYVQGCSMMAAMCLGFTAGREEEGFWLFIHLLEDVLGPDFFSRQPALLGYHGDRAAAAALVASQSPSLAELMGVQCLGESISALASRCLLSGFVGFLSGPPLVAFWEELLQVRCTDFPRLPLISWLAGLVHHAEGQLASALVGLSSDEAVPVFFRTVQQAAKALPNNWRPRVRVSRAQVLELRQISKAAAEKYRSAQEALSLKEIHAKNVSASLDRTCSALLDAMKFAEVSSSAASAGSGAAAAQSSSGKQAHRAFARGERDPLKYLQHQSAARAKWCSKRNGSMFLKVHGTQAHRSVRQQKQHLDGRTKHMTRDNTWYSATAAKSPDPPRHARPFI